MGRKRRRALPGRKLTSKLQCADVSLLVNNAGVMAASTFTSAPSLDAARLEMETNYFGTLSMCRAFAPVLAAYGGGRSRCSPTSGPGSSRHRCRVITS
jgi:NAD(P)-dependent dehydrogenase (short-subunit alcohol dehydrogenase family)